ncbi:MAG: SRPBCC family protein [Steroidobacteraceae bacterium]
MLKLIAMVLVVLIAGVLVAAALRPDTFRVQRSTRIEAPPQKIFPLINDIHRWGLWSPYEKLDPAMKRTFIGAPEGVGAIYEWEGNRKAGQGRMQIVESTPPAKVVIKLEFIKPIAGHDVAEFSLRPQGAATEVIWAMDGPSPYIAKVMGLFLDMDKLIGRDFETGLANLKAVAEK